MYGCISKQVTDSEIKQLLRILVKALESYTDLTLIEGIVMCLTRLQPMLRNVSTVKVIYPELILSNVYMHGKYSNTKNFSMFQKGALGDFVCNSSAHN